ncbi:hypothetical protein ElyMa_006750500 [Elysia marginata]|uniref:Uncharacterized protein n=1 Tax=Elysia marginata TaxID=1093978 RepID=A0AAV4IWX4_9GAST|nr:hypothetical protein ElyMa_006750500 [Elysia marginata]
MVLPQPRISGERQLGWANGNLAKSGGCFATEKVVRSGNHSIADSSLRCYPSAIPTAASRASDVTTPAVDAPVYKVYRLPPSYRKETSNEKPPRRFTSKDINLEATGKTPRTENHLAASRVENANSEDTGRKTSNEKPFNTSPCQRVDSRLKPVS